MKKVYLFTIMCLLGVMVSQSVFADGVFTYPNVTITIEGGTVTINSTKAGALDKVLKPHERDLIDAIAAATDKIVFVGKFGEQDLKSLQKTDGPQQDQYNCCTQKTVDMAEAKFMKNAGGGQDRYKLYNGTPSTENVHANDKCLAGGTLWQSDEEVKWVKVEQGPANNHYQPSNGWTAENINTEHANDYNVNDYVRIATASHYYMLEGEGENRHWTLVSEDEIPAGVTVHEPNNFTEDQRDDHRYDFGDPPQYICFGTSFDIYQKQKTGNNIWKQVQYNDGREENIEYRFASEDAMSSPSEKNKFAYVGGEEYVFNGSEWTNETSTTEEYDYTKMKFDYWGSNVEEIITSKYATGMMAGQLCNGCTNLKTLTINSGDFAANPNGSVLGNNINSLETVNIKKDVTSLSANMFNGAGTIPNQNPPVQNLKTVTFEDGCQIKTFPTGVFRDTGIKNLTIPSSVEEIQTEAFQSCEQLEVVTFVDTNPNPLVIKNKAFQNCAKIKDVFIEVDPEDRLLICEYNAFDFASMEAQTQIDGSMTTLHFPEESFDYYAGEWKKGMAFTQSELNAFKDGIEIKDDQGNVIYANPDTQNPGAWGQYGFSAIEKYDDVDGYYHNPNGGDTKYAPGNGWQQFAKTASNREIYVTGNIYMTYSTNEPYSLPEGIIAFRITDYGEPTMVNGKTTLGKLVLKMIDQVPTETGMLLISTDQYKVKATDVQQNPNIQSMFFFGDPVGEDDPVQYHYTMGRAGDATSNYLAPAVHDIAVGPVSGAPNPVTGVVDLKASTHRNFAMHKTKHNFIRVKKITMPDNRAFLSLPKTMFTNNNEEADDGPWPWNTKAGDAFESYETTDYDEAKTFMFFEYDVDKYGMIWPLAQKEDVTDGIDEVVCKSNAWRVQQGIFTLQGVKVDAPTTKGIYIVNGKKVVIK